MVSVGMLKGYHIIFTKPFYKSSRVKLSEVNVPCMSNKIGVTQWSEKDVLRVAEIVAEYRRRLSNGETDIEFEARLGTYTFDGRFESRVTDDDFWAFRRQALQYEGVTSTQYQYHDFKYIHNGRMVRTRVAFDEGELNVKCTTIEKIVLKKVTIGIDEDANTDERSTRYAVRIQLSKEAPLKDVPTFVARTEHMRIVKRTSIISNSWSYDFSEVWCARTRFDCEQLVKDEDPGCEVELELIDVTYLNTRDDEHVSLGMLMRMQDFTKSCRIQRGM